MDSSQFMVRERTPLALMLYGVYVYLSANSLRRASSILEPLIGRSHEAIRQWVQRPAPVCDRFLGARQPVGDDCVAVGEDVLADEGGACGDGNEAHAVLPQLQGL
jgi:hypothetical protein